MRRNTPWLIVLCSLLCVGAAVYGYLRRGMEIRALETKVEGLTAASSDRVDKLQKQLVIARAIANQSIHGWGGAGPPASRATGPKPPTPTPPNTMRTDPAYAALWHKQQLRNVQRIFGDTLAAMKLSPDELARLKELLVDRSDAQMDAHEAAHDAGLSPQEASLAVKQAADEVNGEITALIGDNNFQELQQPQTSVFKPMIESSVGVDLATDLPPSSVRFLMRVLAG